MPSSLVAEYERALADVLQAMGDKRFAYRVFAHAGGGGVWRGLYIGFNSRQGKAIVQPNLAVFCPAADKIVREGFRIIYGRQAGWTASRRVGGPALSWPLYDLTRKLRHQDRMPYSYDVVAEVEIDHAVGLLAEDYFTTRYTFFGSINSLETLQARVLEDDFTGAGMYALVLAYLINGRPADASAVLGPSPNEVTTKFAEWFSRSYSG